MWTRLYAKLGGLALGGSLVWQVPGTTSASDLDTIGVTQLRALVPSLDGRGVWIAQPEAGFQSSTNWEVAPAAVGQSQSLFTWISTTASATNYPNSIGSESAHAESVGAIFYGLPGGVVPGIAHVDNYNADYFANVLVPTQGTNAAKVVNQSFIDDGEFAATELAYDNYVAKYNTIFVSGVGNGGPPNSPATAYNSIGVGASNGSTSPGPTSDGRCKPDITAPGGLTSFTTPLVAGCAVILFQAGSRGDGGSNTVAAATDARTIKCLLLNGTVKPADWTNTTSQPLDYHYGAGVVNVFNSYRQLCGGQHAFVVSTSATAGEPHWPPATTNNVAARRGWDFDTMFTSVNSDRVNHYFFDLRNSTNRLFTLTASLVWNRPRNISTINIFDLFLYSAATSNLVARSQSAVDNVEHLFLTNLPPARYDLQVLKNGQSTPSTEWYALAFDFGPPASAQFVDPTVASAQFHARLLGEPYSTYVIQASADFTSWQPAVTNRMSSLGYFDFTDVPAGANAKRFYRASGLP